jgi:ATP sulfurylase
LQGKKNLVIVTSILIASTILSFGVVYWTEEILKKEERLEIRNIIFEEFKYNNMQINISNVGFSTVELSDIRIGNSSNLLLRGFLYGIPVVMWSRFNAGETWALPVTYDWVSNTTYRIDITTTKGSNFFVTVTSPSMR